MRFLAVSLGLLAAAGEQAQAQSGKATSSLPAAKIGPAVPAGSLQRFTYNVEWRSVHAGVAVVEARPNKTELKLNSAGLVSKLYKIQDVYSVQYEDQYCAISSMLNAMEGKRHRETRVAYDRSQTRAFFTERDLLKDMVVRTTDVAIPKCVHDVVGALAMLRRVVIEPGTSIELPVSDGRRYASVKIEAQEREQVKTPAGTFKSLRLEADLLNGVVYPRKGRVFVWISDDARRVPVQIRLKLSFPIGTVTLGLAKEETQ